MQQEQEKVFGGHWRRYALAGSAGLALSAAAILAGLARLDPDSVFARTTYPTNTLFRLGIVLGAFWLALPTLRRPMRWLPPIFTTLCLVCIGAVAIQPKLLLVLVPACLTILSFAWVWRLLGLGKG